MVDDYVIILVCVLGGLVVLPLLAWLIRRCVLARQHRKVSGKEVAVCGVGGVRLQGSGGEVLAPLGWQP